MQFNKHILMKKKQQDVIVVHTPRRHMVMLAAAIAVACHVSVAHATLGGNSASVEADRIHMNSANPARLTQSSTGSYTVHETTLPTGTIVRQYVSAAGVVFAIAWAGPFKPDLHQLMGSYFDMMITRQAGKPLVSHRFIRQHGSDLVVESAGHQRSFVGRAYLPGELPSGMTEKDIK